MDALSNGQFFSESLLRHCSCHTYHCFIAYYGSMQEFPCNNMRKMFIGVFLSFICYRFDVISCHKLVSLAYCGSLSLPPGFVCPLPACSNTPRHSISPTSLGFILCSCSIRQQGTDMLCIQIQHRNPFHAEFLFGFENVFIRFSFMFLFCLTGLLTSRNQEVC